MIVQKASAALKGPDDNRRVAIWSLTSMQARIFFPLLLSMWVAALGYFIYDEIIRVRIFTSESVKAAIFLFGQTVIPAVAIGMIISALTTSAWRLARPLRRGFAMNILDRLYDKLVKPIEDTGEARGRAEGRTEGRTEGLSEAFDWMDRKADAEAKGIPFDEPPPQPEP